jgi:hypothetical protein
MLAMQIIEYVNKEKILFDGQHGFRNNHSCETALHELITDMNKIRSNREIGMFLFIDFRKAFDLVDSKILMLKLKKYGFDQQAIQLISNYFENRTQMVKLDNVLSSTQPIKLSVPQGSVLGPLFFLLFINDLAKYLKSINCKLFADDTTLYKSSKDLNNLISSVKESINDLINWCNYNKVDINWSKTYCMFINKTRNVTPSVIEIDNRRIEVVSSFRLLGVIIDDKLNFLNNCRELCNNVNKRLYSIKKIFYLPFSVKVQFFKTFILPYFDYCSTLLIYFPKESIQKLANAYNQSIFKLLGFKSRISQSNDFNKFNNFLEKYNLANFQHRIINQLMIFIHKILRSDNSPTNLKKSFEYNCDLNKRYELRNLNELRTPRISNLNNYGELTFNFFFSKMINRFCVKDLDLDFGFFRLRTKNNINLIFNEFIKIFIKFDLNYNIYI